MLIILNSKDMTVNIKEVACPLYEGVCMNLWQVDYTDRETPTDFWITFGVYEREEVAIFVKQQIENGLINVVPIALEGSFEIYKQFLEEKV